MIFEIDNTLAKVVNGWRFTGHLIEDNKRTSISGMVPDLKTDGMIKRAIIDKVEQMIENYQKQPASQVKILTEDAIFKSKLQAI